MITSFLKTILAKPEFQDLEKNLELQRNEWSKEKDRLQTILDAMAEGVLVTDHQSVIMLMNPAMQKMLGRHDDAKGQSVLEGMRHYMMDEVIKRVIQTGQSEQIEIEIILNNEKKIWMMQTVRLPDNDAHGSVSVFHDVTPVRHLETLRRDFVTNISHELKTPLTSIRGYAETLKDGALNDVTMARKFLEKIERNAIQLQSLVEDILHLSEIESGNMEWHLQTVDVVKTFESVVRDFQSMADSKRIELLFDAPSNLPKIECDAQALDQILNNLVSNAIRYTPLGGQVILKALHIGGSVEISVCDTGIGIPAKDMTRIFERFYRVDKARSRELGGTGLGLAIVKHLVQAQGGSISVESKEGIGTRFHFQLPIK